MLGELVLVAVGVYAGIVASNYNEERKETRRQREFLQTLALEIAANEHKLQQALAYREKILTASNRLREGLSQDTLKARFWSVGGFQLLKHWQGVYIPPLEKSVYESGLISNTLSGLDFPTIHAIAQVYTYQDEYKEWTRMLITDKIVPMSQDVTTQQVLANLQPWADIMHTEKELIKKYQAALKQLKPKAP